MSPASPATPAEAASLLRNAFAPVGTETVPLANAAGRVLAQALHADRPSPACDVSAMDGFAIRLADLARGTIPVVGQSRPGQPAAPLAPNAAHQIFTGAPVPSGAELVVRREDVGEAPGQITFRNLADRGAPGMFIRRAGENAAAGTSLAEPGQLITPALIGASAAVGAERLLVHRLLRVTILTTGDELVSGRAPAPWEIRDSNGPVLRALLDRHAFVGQLDHHHVPDDLPTLTRTLALATERSDLILLTGGVSMGDFDHVPAAAIAMGATTLFHKLPIRPGKPLFAARGPQGQAILGLPGNPLSVLVTARRFAVEVIQRRAGTITPPPHLVTVAPEATPQSAPLWWYRLARIIGSGQVTLLDPKSSGDGLAAARADGFVEVPPNQPPDGSLPYYDFA